MTQVYFHCSNKKKVSVDRRGAVVDDVAEARDHATHVVQSFTNERSHEDLRDWVLHASDDGGDELFVVPFAFVLGEPH
jgi:sirohydrochlorin ferrochelatase